MSRLRGNHVYIPLILMSPIFYSMDLNMLIVSELMNSQVPSFFIRKLTTQVFSFINIQLFNRYLFSFLIFWAYSYLWPVRESLNQNIGSLLLRRECCTFSNGEYVKSGLAELEKWIVNATEEVFIIFFLSISRANCLLYFPSLSHCCMQFAGTSWHELNYIRQAVGFLVSSTVLIYFLWFWY